MTGINNRYDVYGFAPGTARLDVDRQIIGFFRASLYKMQVACTLRAE